MKTDKFEENIRQKMEEIDPPFREKDWLKLRSFLRRNGLSSIGGTGTQWLVPMMSAATVAGLLILAVWQYRTNQKLEQTVRSLKDTVTILQQAQVADVPKTVPDTVYRTREIEAPRLLPATPGYQPDDRRFVDRSETENQSKTGRNDNEAPTKLSPFQKPDDKLALKQPGAKERLTQSTTERERSESSERNTEPSNPSKSSGNETDRSLSSGTSAMANQAGSFEPVVSSSELASLSWKPILNRPFQFDSNYYAENYQQRIRRIRPLHSPSVISSLAAANKPDVEVPQPFVQIRIGASGAIGVGQSVFGLAGEVLIGDHLTVGVGLNRLKLSGDNFLSDLQYNVKRKSDFRRDYPGRAPADMRIEIMDISQSGKLWQLPVNLGYRLPINNSITVIPSVGVNFSLTAREQIKFTHRKGPYDFYQAKFYEKRPTNLYNSWLLSIAVEKQWNHWAVQVVPYLSNPIVRSRYSLNQTSAGLRARVLYQF